MMDRLDFYTLSIALVPLILGLALMGCAMMLTQ